MCYWDCSKNHIDNQYFLGTSVYIVRISYTKVFREITKET